MRHKKCPDPKHSTVRWCTQCGFRGCLFQRSLTRLSHWNHQEFIKIQGHRPCTEWNMLEAGQTYFPKTGGVTNKPRLCPALAGTGAPEYCYLWGAKNPIGPGGMGFEAR